jgi:hypothetical protein
MFTLSLITGADLCDLLIKSAQRDQRVLEARITNLSVRNENSSENSASYAAELSELTAGISTSVTILAALPEGNLKEKELTKKMELELRLRKLTTGEISYSPEAILEREYEILKCTKLKEAAAEFEAALVQRKSEF